MKSLIAIFGVAMALGVGTASAQWTFQATLWGTNESPANASTATGFGTVVLNAAQTQITVNESWTGLIGGPATASHIHGPGGIGPTGPTNASVIFPFSGVPAATSGSIPQQSFTITAQQVSWLFAGYLYMNVHDNTFGGGEIRGQLLLVPEPSTAALLGLGVGAIAIRAIRKRAKRLQG
jgi:CHRD domain/PEP-CTERM motif